MKALLGPDGTVIQANPGMAFRPAQLKMAEFTLQALTRQENAIVEAPTGTGKSIAYLAAAAVNSLTADKPQTIVATATRHLQDQLILHDIPALTQGLQRYDPQLPTLQASVLKGRNAYLCYHYAYQPRHGANAEQRKQNRQLLQQCQDWERNHPGRIPDRDNLALPPVLNWIWERNDASACSSQNATHRFCPYYRAVQTAKRSHILIVNQHLLILGHAQGIPHIAGSHSGIIIDEAHALENSAAAALGFNIRPQEVDLNLDRLLEQTQNAANALHTREEQLSLEQTQNHLNEIMPIWQNLKSSLSRLSRNYVTENQQYSNQQRINHATLEQPQWQPLLNHIREIIPPAVSLKNAAAAHRKAWNLDGTLERFLQTAQGLATIANPARYSNTVCWLETPPPRAGAASLNGSPIRVDQLLETYLYHPQPSVCLSSATLRTPNNLSGKSNDEPSWEYAMDRLGYFPRANRLAIASPFDAKRALTLIHSAANPKTAPEQHQDLLHRTIQWCARTIHGVLGLFTSNKQLENACRACREPLAQAGIRLIAQNEDGSPAACLQRYTRLRQAGIPACLLGVDSFWEGIDLPGDLLRCVIIAKLPYAVPTHPLTQARLQEVANRKYHGDLRQAYAGHERARTLLRTRQAAGRLLRHETDYGVIILLDSRNINATSAALSDLNVVPYASPDLVTAHLQHWRNRSQQPALSGA